MDAYRELAWGAWTSQPRPSTMVDIPANKAQLMGRINDFDGGHTARWLTSLQVPTWRAVQGSGGHTIHCVSDRTFEDLTTDLRFGLRLLTWMSSRAVTWYWWDHPWPRVLPADTEPGRDHLNGGWAIPGVPEVHVYRREEAHKVLIHESIHALGLDVSPALVAGPRAEFEAALGRSLWPHLGEAFTELYAEWLWSIAGASSQSDARGRWAEQLRCSEHQAATLWARIRGSTQNEDTNVFAYYILKWVLMKYTTEVLLSPSHSVKKWVSWWRAALPELNQMADASASAGSNSLEFRMGMTCR